MVRRCFPFHSSFPATPSHPMRIGGTKKRKMGGDAPNAIRKTLFASQTGRTAMPAATAPAPRHQPPMGKAPVTGRVCRDRVCAENGGRPMELERIRSAFGQRQAPCGRRFSAFRKGRQHLLPAKRQPHRAPALQKGGAARRPRAPAGHRKRRERAVAPLPPFARLCQGRPDRSPGRGRVTKS